MRSAALFIILTLSILFYLQIGSNSMPYEACLSTCVILSMISIAICVTGKESNAVMKKNWVSVFYLFLFAFMIVHFQKYIDILVLPNMTDTFNVYSNHIDVLKTAYISLMGLVSMLLGYHMQRTYKTYYYIKPLNQYDSCTRGSFKAVSVLFFVSVLLFFAINGRLYLSGGYSQEMINSMSGSINAYIVLLVDFMMYAATLINSIQISKQNHNISFRDYLKSYNLIYYISLFVYLFLVYSSGDRGPIITYMCAFFFGYLLVSKKKVNIVSIVVLFFVASIAISVMGVARQDSNRGKTTNAEYYQTVMAGESVLPLTDELANSNRTAIWAIESTPAPFPYRKGLYALNNLVSIVPFSNSILRPLGIDFTYMNRIGHSSAFLDWYSQGDNVTAGVGTSTIADIYLDFGPIGVIIIMFLLGCLFRKVDYISKTYETSQISLWWLVVSIVLFSNAIYMSRSVLLFQLRNIVWLYVVMLLILNINKKITYER